MRAKDFLQGARVFVWDGLYSVVQARRCPELFVACLRDRSEITVVCRQEDVDPAWVIREERDWRILTFDITLPFELTGFLAAVAGVLAEAGVPIFALSAFSTDHLLVKSAHLPIALAALEGLGCRLGE